MRLDVDAEGASSTARIPHSSFSIFAFVSCPSFLSSSSRSAFSPLSLFLRSATIHQLVPRQVHGITWKCHSGTERSIVPRMFHAESVPQRCRELVVTGLDANSNRNGSIDVTLSIYCLNFAHIRGMDLERESVYNNFGEIIENSIVKVIALI